MMNAVILVVNAEASEQAALKRRLGREGYEIHVASSAAQGLQQLDRQMPDAILFDLQMPGDGGLAFLAAVRGRDATLPMLAMAATEEVAAAVEAMRQGATDFIEKPFDGDDVAERVARALAATALRKEVLQFQPELVGLPTHSGEVLLGQTPAMRGIYRVVRKLSRSSSTTVLIEGESGTGKELVAQAIHATSARRDKPFVAVNCAALTESLLEAELFGYEKGAFTGAAATGKAGLFEAANGGTIFLDEIGEMGFDLQAKLLRVLEDRRFLRVGGTENVEVDVRVIASTNRNLLERVHDGAFRRDLYFRLKVVTITTPPLRERREDILLLAKYFLDLYARQFGAAIEGFTEEAERLLRSYPWPGNVRELKNAIESAVILESGNRISHRTLQLDAARLLHAPRQADDDGTFRSYRDGGDEEEDLSIAAMERRHILRVLTETMWQRGQAASLLGIHRTTLANKIREYRLADA